jgi:hypothetical protein
MRGAYDRPSVQEDLPDAWNRRCVHCRLERGPDSHRMWSGQETTPTALIVDEVRALAIDASNSPIATALHRTGWAEASGQTLSQSDFPELSEETPRLWLRQTAVDGAAAVTHRQRHTMVPDRDDERNS